jgi:hypothetical protein
MSELTDRELDLAIAEKVMGWEWRQFQPRYSNEWRRVLFESHIVNPDFPQWTGEEMEITVSSMIPGYSTNLLAAFDVVENLRGKGFGFLIGTRAGGWIVRIVIELDMQELEYKGNADTLPRAICLAALKSVEETK